MPTSTETKEWKEKDLVRIRFLIFLIKRSLTNNKDAHQADKAELNLVVVEEDIGEVGGQQRVDAARSAD